MMALALNAVAQPSPLAPPTPPPGRPLNPAPGANATPPAMPDKDRLSYAIGFNIGSSLKRDHVDVDPDTLATAIKDVLAGGATRLNESETSQVMRQLQAAMQAKKMAEQQKQMAENKVKGEEFMATNGKAPGVITLTNGLEYKVLTEGSGPMPTPADSVIVSYKGSLIDGTVFDKNEHFTTPVTGRTIKGWSEILPMMKTGSKWQVAIPPELAYGPRSQRNIGPDSVLVFEMELLSITNTSLAAPPPPRPTAPTTPVVSGQIIKVPSAEELKNGAKIEVITNVPSNQ